MWKRIRQLQPAHEGGSFTVEEAARAFRQVRGATPKCGIFADDAIIRRDTSGLLMIWDPEPGTVVVTDFEEGSARKPRARSRIVYRKGVLRRW